MDLRMVDVLVVNVILDMYELTAIGFRGVNEPSRAEL